MNVPSTSSSRSNQSHSQLINKIKLHFALTRIDTFRHTITVRHQHDFCVLIFEQELKYLFVVTSHNVIVVVELIEVLSGKYNNQQQLSSTEHALDGLL